MALAETVDERFLSKYRALLDAEDEAFDTLEHCCEDGDRSHFAECLQAWKAAVERKLVFLHRAGMVNPPALNN